jgi:cytochrome o ubiquinol oxidase operon protein cyoD
MSEGSPHLPHITDSGPGEQPVEPSEGGVLSYVVGLGLAIVLTIASFYFAGSDAIWGPAIPIALIVLAIAQMGVHLVFFLHITTSPDNTNNVMALGFGVLIVFLVIGGSVWIMDHMNHNMMPMQQIMQMQQ